MGSRQRPTKPNPACSTRSARRVMGPRPSLKGKVRVHYRGMLMNGTVFDSSYNEEEPLKFSLKRVIKGWQEGIQLMPEGSIYTFLIPPDLAYGEKGTQGIPPNSTLIFDVDLYSR